MCLSEIQLLAKNREHSSVIYGVINKEHIFFLFEGILLENKKLFVELFYDKLCLFDPPNLQLHVIGVNLGHPVCLYYTYIKKVFISPGFKTFLSLRNTAKLTIKRQRLSKSKRFPRTSK